MCNIYTIEFLMMINGSLMSLVMFADKISMFRKLRSILLPNFSMLLF